MTYVSAIEFGKGVRVNVPPLVWGYMYIYMIHV